MSRPGELLICDVCEQPRVRWQSVVVERDHQLAVVYCLFCLEERREAVEELFDAVGELPQQAGEDRV